MKSINIAYPAIALFGHISLLLIFSFFKRLKAIKKREVDVSFFKTYHNTDGVPRQILALSRNYENLFEMPTFFFFLCSFIAITQKVDNTFVLLAWGYFFARVTHSFIHVSKNKIYPRMTVFAISWFLLIVMGIRLIVIA